MRRFLNCRRAVSLGIRFANTTPAPPTAAAPQPSTSEVVYSKEEIDSLVHALEKNDQLLEGVICHMQAHHRRRLVIAGGAMEWFGKESVAQEIASADSDNDRVISPKDFDNWFAQALSRNKPRAEGAATENHAAAAAAAAAIPFSALVFIAVEAGLPFVGFGFLDNATMILAGDLIDQSLGFYLNCSVMASAAMGNVVSGMLGMQVHGFVEKAVQRLNLPVPVLTEEQRRGRRVFFAGHLGGTIGIMIGLSLGMLPLMFIQSDTEKADAAAFRKWDANNDGSLEATEIRRGIHHLGLGEVNQTVLDTMLTKYGKDGKINAEGFSRLCHDLRQQAHMKH